jgi:hypothetical protein
MQLDSDKKRCLDSLVWAIEQLHGEIEMHRLHQTADLIIQTMTGPWRFFHTPEHIFEVGGAVGAAGEAIEVLAALFHDLVYVQVDQGISVNISSYISPFVKEDWGKLIIRDQNELGGDRLFALVAAIFGFVPGQILPTGGQNEFLSAVIAAKSLEGLLSFDIIAQISACIEATIPFRPKLASGLDASECLYQRLLKVNETFGFGWADEKTQAIVKQAVRVANRDVENFAFVSSAHFLANTWNLLPETNHHLKSANSYTVQGYRTSIQKMEGFMSFLKPELVFQQFQGEPDDQTYQDLVNRTRKNLEVARLYLGAKLVSIGIVEALSFRIGHDIPISTMMGELPSTAHSAAQLEHFIPIGSVRVLPETSLENEVLELLEIGRSLNSSYDVKNSPIATYVVKSIGFVEVRKLLEQAKAFFDGDITSEEFLSSCDPDVVRTVTNGVLELFESRKMALGQLMRSPQ